MKSADQLAAPGLFSLPRWIDQDIQRVEALLTSTAGASPHRPVSEACLHLVKAGGKRLRPALVLLTSHAGKSGHQTTDMSAAAIELIHLASLYHDDVLDETATRRGVPTAHTRWGIEVAVLAGDYLFAAGCALGAEAGGEVPGILARAIVSVCEGQIVESAALNDPRRSIPDYLETIRLKTAALFAAACELGAVTSGARPSERSAVAAYGGSLGLAFQVVDDILDLVANPEDIGKTPGTDLREGVFTAPVLLACERSPELRRRLIEGDRALDTVLPVVIRTGALQDAVAMATSFGESALVDIGGLGDAAWREDMKTVVHGVLRQLDDALARRGSGWGLAQPR